MQVDREEGPLLRQGLASPPVAPHARHKEAARDGDKEGVAGPVGPTVPPLGPALAPLLTVVIPGADAVLKEASLGPVATEVPGPAVAKAPRKAKGAHLAVAPVA